MENQELVIETLFEKTKSYTNSSLELYKLKAIDKSADMMSTLIKRLTLAVFFIFCFLFLNTGLALLIGEALGRTSFGFLIVAGFYAIVGIVFYLFRDKWIKVPMRNSIITHALN
jgi:ammonia channel protein AmtB